MGLQARLELKRAIAWGQTRCLRAIRAIVELPLGRVSIRLGGRGVLRRCAERVVRVAPAMAVLGGFRAVILLRSTQLVNELLAKVGLLAGVAHRARRALIEVER